MTLYSRIIKMIATFIFILTKVSRKKRRYSNPNPINLHYSTLQHEPQPLSHFIHLVCSGFCLDWIISQPAAVFCLLCTTFFCYEVWINNGGHVYFKHITFVRYANQKSRTQYIINQHCGLFLQKCLLLHKYNFRTTYWLINMHPTLYTHIAIV